MRAVFAPRGLIRLSDGDHLVSGIVIHRLQLLMQMTVLDTENPGPDPVWSSRSGGATEAHAGGRKKSPAIHLCHSHFGSPARSRRRLYLNHDSVLSGVSADIQTGRPRYKNG